jgi:preprotein translocase subunit SecA
MLKSLIKAIFGDPNKKEIKKLTPLVEEVNQLEAEMQRMSAEEIRQMMAEFKANLRQETAELRAETKELHQQVIDTVGKERQQLQIRLEQTEKTAVKTGR